MKSIIKQLLVLLLLIFPIGISVAQITDNPSANGVLGQPDFVSKVAGLTSNGLTGPNGVVVDPISGKVFVVDRSNNRVLRWSSAAAQQDNSEAEAVFGQTDFVTKTSGLAADKLNAPIGVTMNNMGTLWVADFGNNRVLRFDNAAEKESGAAADGVLGQADFVSNASVTSASGMKGPVGIHVDGKGTLWVNEFNNHRITRFDMAANKANGADADGVLGQPDFVTGTSGLAAGKMASPNGVYADPKGNVWVSDNGNFRVLRFDAAAEKADGSDADGVLGQPDFVTKTSAVTRNGFSSLRFVWGDSQGRIYVIQEGSHRMTIYNDAANKANGADADYIWGQADYVTGTAANPPTASSYNTPRALYIDEARNNLWMVDYANNRVLRYDVEYTKPIDTAPFIITDNPSANGVLGQPDFVSKVAGLTSNGLTGPNGVVVDPISGKVFVVDRSNNRVLRWSSSAAQQDNAEAEAVFGQTDFVTKTSGLAADKLNAPIGVTMNNMGTLWVADFGNNRVLRFDNAAEKESGAAADGVLGQADFVSNASVTSASGMKGPVGIHVDGKGTLWVNEFNNHRITRFDMAVNKANGADADGVLGQPDFVTGTSGLTAGKMASPNGVYADPKGNVWVSDNGNFRVLRFDAAAEKADGSDADGVLGQPDFVTKTSAVTRNGFSSLRFVWGDSQGRIYVIQEGSHRMTIYNDAANKANGADADYIWGQADYVTGTAANPPASNTFNTPRALYIDEARNNLWMVDYANNRVLRYDLLRENVATLKLNYPNGGESFAFGKMVSISWTANNVNNVKLEYSLNNGADWSDITIVPAINGTFEWAAPSVVSNEALVRISDAENAGLADQSDAVFSIAEPVEVVTLISPNGYQHWSAASKKKILFGAQDVNLVDLYYSMNNGTDWILIASEISADAGEYVWELPNSTSNEALVRVTKSGTTDIEDSSAKPFAIVEAEEGHEQDFIFFADSPTPGFYDPSWNFVTAPSTLLRTAEKMIVTTDYSYVGNYSIILNWKSATGGNWGAAIAGVGWVGRDFTTKDTLEFKVFTEDGLNATALPVIYVEDFSNNKSAKMQLADFTSDLTASSWNTIKIPVSTIVDNKGAADLTRVKTVFFGQNTDDNVEHTVYVDQMRVTGGDIITGENRNLIVVIGSSTSAGTGASTVDSSYVGRFRNFMLTEDPNSYLVNLAVGGYTSYDLMPSDFVAPSGRPTPKVNNNITYALTYKPDAILLNLPSNDTNIGMTIQEQISNFDAIMAAAGDVPVWVTTTQPRNFTDANQRNLQMQMRDSIMTKYGSKAIMIFNELAEEDGTIKAKYNSGDGIHLNDSGHRYLYEQVVASGIWGYVTSNETLESPIQSFELFQNYPNPFNPSTQIRFNVLNANAKTTLTVYDAIGRKVAVLVNDVMSAGSYTVHFDGTKLSSGVYFYHLQSGSFQQVKQMTLIK